MIDYKKELARVLRTFDPSEMRKFFKENSGLWGRGFPDFFLSLDDDTIKANMAKMVINDRDDMSYNDIQKAKEILRELKESERLP